jgi:hypothetical protein
MKKQELIKHIERLPYESGPIVDKIKISRKGLVNLIEQLDEPQKPVVPQFVADWYEENKDDFEGNLFRCINTISSMYEDEELNDFENWVIEAHTEPFQTLVNMHQFGYTVEKEPKYTVKIKSVNQYLVRNTDEDFLGFLQSRLKSKFTRKELEEAGLSDVFNSPLFEVEEV